VNISQLKLISEKFDDNDDDDDDDDNNNNNNNTYMHGIYNYVSETDHISGVHTVAAVL
jgi:hypothetical protein